MEKNISKMSEEELYRHIAQINEKINIVSRQYSNSPIMMNQLQYMQEMANMELSDRIQRIHMKEILDRTPATVDLSEEKKKKVDKNNSRAKSKSDIISRMRRTKKPTEQTD